MRLMFIFFILMTSQIQANTCVRNLELPAPRLGRTESLISYLTLLIDQQVIGEKEISVWREQLQAGTLTNPIASNSTAVDSSALVHYGEVQKQIERSGFDLSRLLKWSEDLLTTRQKAQVARTDVQQDTKDLYREMKFQKIPGAKTPMGAHFIKWIRWHVKKEISTSMPPRILHSFEMMSTPVTQKQWIEIMKINPTSSKVEKEDVIIGDKLVPMAPDNPVEFVTWWSAVDFANRLSELAGLKPAYDLSKVSFSSNSSAAEGDLSHAFGEMGINAPGGNIYLAEGYRLPTAAEHEHILRLAFNNQKALPYPLVGPNSYNFTRRVDALPPIMINGQPFYDLLGNVFEWTHDIPVRDLFPRGLGMSTERVPLYLRRTNHGGLDPKNLNMNWWSASYRSWNVGFRLVRTIKP